MGSKRRASNSSISTTSPLPKSASSVTIPRRRSDLREIQQLSTRSDDVISPKVINAGPSLKKATMYGFDDQRPMSSRIMALAGRIFIETIPQCFTVGLMLALIIGGCCSNVFALEAIVNVEPESGTLLTFVQFLFVAATGYFAQFDRERPPFFLRPNRVPLRRWIINIVLFFTINVLNNHAFSYSISVPIHIILRSGGSITTLLAGYLWGKRFTRTQVLAVTLLTVGVIIAAWSDQNSKKDLQAERGLPPFSKGLGILFLAQVLSAIMGLYTEETYRDYGPHWKENLFYSHLLALPLFIPFVPSMYQQYLRLKDSTLLGLPPTERFSSLPGDLQKGLGSIRIPSQLAYLIINVLTQYACIRGVNLLASAVSALTVTIVLNIRKLVSLLLSIWLFDNRLSPGTMIGALIVFFAGGLYGIAGSKGQAKARHRATHSNGKAG